MKKHERAYMSIPEIAARFRVGQVKVRFWIRSGELGTPINVASTTRGRPRLVVSIAAVEAFEQRRAVEQEEVQEGPIKRQPPRRLPKVPQVV